MRLDQKTVNKILAEFNHPLAKIKANELKLGRAYHPEVYNTAIDLEHDKQRWTLLFDEEVTNRPSEIELLFGKNIKIWPNPHPNSDYALPWEQKSCYLIEHVSTTERLDKLLAQANPELSRQQIQQLIKLGKVELDGQALTKSSLQIDPAKLTRINLSLPEKPEPLDLPIIYQDEQIIAIDKPAGVLSQTRGKNLAQTEYTVADFWRQHGEFTNSDSRGGLVHRLDRATSGVMLGAKNPQTRELIQKMFKNRQVQKTYLAIVSGKMAYSEAKINFPLARSVQQSGRFVVAAHGKPAETNYKVLSTNQKYSLLEVQPITGRTHQIRVHLAQIGHPIVGDALYGGAKAERLMLHALRLSFKLPQKETIVITAPKPKEFSHYV